MMIVNYGKQLREAFEAGKRAGAAPFIKAKFGEETAKWVGDVPETYEEWLKSISHRPQIARG